MRSPGGLVAVVAMLVLAAFAAPPAGAASRAPHSERALLAVMNRARTSRGLGALRVDQRLRTAARAHSAEMLRYGYDSAAPTVRTRGLRPCVRLKRPVEVAAELAGC